MAKNKQSSRDSRESEVSHLSSISSGIMAAELGAKDVYRWRVWANVLFPPLMICLVFLALKHYPVYSGGISFLEHMASLARDRQALAFQEVFYVFLWKELLPEAFLITLIWSSVVPFLLGGEAPSWRKPLFSPGFFIYYLAFSLFAQVSCTLGFLDDSLWGSFSIMLGVFVSCWLGLRFFCLPVLIVMGKPHLFRVSWQLTRRQVWSIFWGALYFGIKMALTILLPFTIASFVFVFKSLDTNLFVRGFTQIFALLSALVTCIYACQLYKVLSAFSEEPKA